MLLRDFMRIEMQSLDLKFKHDPEEGFCLCCGIAAASPTSYEQRTHCWDCHEFDYPFIEPLYELYDRHSDELERKDYSTLYCFLCKKEFKIEVDDKGNLINYIENMECVEVKE